MFTRYGHAEHCYKLNIKTSTMKLIILPRLRLAQLQAITETTLTICKNLTQVASEMLGIENVFNPFKAGMLKDQVSA